MKKALRVLGFLCVFVIVYFFMDATLELKTEDGIKTMQVYYELPEDTVDVLIVGSSHVGMNVDSSILWDEYGIASYNLWSGMQPVWNSYYAIKEALKTQNPKVVVLEAFLCGIDYEYSDATATYKFIQGMHPSMDKVNAALSSFETWQQAAEALWGLPIYHARYDELTKDDFKLGITNDDMMPHPITYAADVSYPISMLDYGSITDAKPLSQKAEMYLRKIIDLCNGQGIDLMIMIAPFEATQDEYIRINSVESIAQTENVPYLNYLEDYLKAGIDPQTDFLDIGHLNLKGISKLSRSIGNYLSTYYVLPDRREDKNHLWQQGLDTTQLNPPDYALTQQFLGDGMSRNVDTGIKLYDNSFGTWTLLARLNRETVDDDQVYLSCFSEVQSAGNYGLLVRKKDNGLLSLKLGDNIETEVAFAGDTLDLAIVKQSQSYTIYVDGECVAMDRELPCRAYTGNLLIGCQELSPGGEKFRFSQTHTESLEVYQNRVLSAQVIGAWAPEALEKMKMPMGYGSGEAAKVYSLTEQFMGEEEKYVQNAFVDTGMQLFDEPANSFTLLARITPETFATNNVFLSCFSEEENNYRGLLVRQVQEGEINIVFGGNNGIQFACEQGESIDLAIVKNMNTYTMYANGVKVCDQVVSSCEAHMGSLLIGCQEGAQGEKFRFSQTHVQSLQIFSGVLEEQAIQAFQVEDAPVPNKRIASSANYQLPNPFLGDGNTRFIDTGVQLFDVPSKEWTLGITLTPGTSVASGVYLSCFSEDTQNYRGLLLRQDEAETLNIWMGGVKTHAITLPSNHEPIRLVIVKQADKYSIYQNGVLEVQVDSPCTVYEGTLLVGCQEWEDGEKFRFSSVKVDELQVSDGAMGAEEASQYSMLDAKANPYE